MAYRKLSLLAAALVFTSLSAVGCNDKAKAHILALTNEKNDLLAKNRDMRGQLASATSRNTELLTQLDAKDLEIESIKVERDKALVDLVNAQDKADEADKTAAGWKATTVGHEISVGSDVLFSAGRATLSRAGKSVLGRIASDLKSTYAGMSVRVYGYTDADPIKKSKRLWTDNLDLSVNRAMAVSRYLIGKGINASLIETVGMGATHPVSDSTSKSGKAKNRRVEIMVLKRPARAP